MSAPMQDPSQHAKSPEKPAAGLRLPVAPEGLPIIAVFVAVAAALWWLWWPLGVVGGALSAWCVWFFRDPERAPDPQGGSDPRAVLSPADGVIEMIATAPPPAGLSMTPEPRQRVSVFMNVLNVHVNRAPSAGRVGAIAYHAGKFMHAAADKASDENERLALKLSLPDGEAMAVVQIAGLIARRIVCRVKEGVELARGERYGLIRFGSRVDVYLPPDAAVRVVKGQRVVAGETVIAVRGKG